VKSTRVTTAVLAAALVTAGGPPGLAAPADYPTEALADYVFGCMASNGQTQESLQRCSCSIDVIASIVPYERYVQAETVVSMAEVPGEKTAMFRDVAWINELVADLRRAQAEAEVRCF